MQGKALFISYSHQDMAEENWLDRLKLYLEPLRRQRGLDIWDDTRIGPGSNWLSAITSGMDQATASVLIVGPGFLASEFICEQELPVLLDASKTRGVKIFPLVVGYCSYKTSPLGPYQSLNSPEKPLEALPAAEQNRWLNNLSNAIEMEMFEEFEQQPEQPVSTEQSPMAEWQGEYSQVYNRTKGYMLVHVYRPSTVPGQKFDIFIFVLRHRSGDPKSPYRNFEEIKKAEFFFGPGWGNKIFPVANTGGLIGVRTHAWGTFFAACRITFNDPNSEPIILYRYIDFEMAPQST